MNHCWNNYVLLKYSVGIFKQIKVCSVHTLVSANFYYLCLKNASKKYKFSLIHDIVFYLPSKFKSNLSHLLLQKIQRIIVLQYQIRSGLQFLFFKSHQLFLRNGSQRLYFYSLINNEGLSSKTTSNALYPMKFTEHIHEQLVV